MYKYAQIILEKLCHCYTLIKTLCLGLWWNVWFGKNFGLTSFMNQALTEATQETFIKNDSKHDWSIERRNQMASRS